MSPVAEVARFQANCEVWLSCFQDPLSQSLSSSSLTSVKEGGSEMSYPSVRKTVSNVKREREIIPECNSGTAGEQTQDLECQSDNPTTGPPADSLNSHKPSPLFLTGRTASFTQQASLLDSIFTTCSIFCTSCRVLS